MCIYIYIDIYYIHIDLNYCYHYCCYYFPRLIKNEGPSLALRLSTATRTLVSRPFT